jgi:hypothetical protein
MAFPSTFSALVTNQSWEDGVTIVEATPHNIQLAAHDALEAKVGVDGSAVTTSLDYKVGAGHTPHAYAGEESVTLPNGLIMKFGKTSTPTGDVSGNPTVTVTYGTAFPAGVLSVNITPKGPTYPESLRHGISASSVSAFTINYSESQAVVQNMDGFYWIAIGY